MYLFSLPAIDSNLHCDVVIRQLLSSAFEDESFGLSTFLREGIAKFNSDNVQLKRSMFSDLKILDPIRLKYWDKCLRECDVTCEAK